LPYGYNRAKLAWYNIEPTLQDKTASNCCSPEDEPEAEFPKINFNYVHFMICPIFSFDPLI